MSKVNHTLARLRLCRMRMRREGKLLLTGYTPTRGSTVDVSQTWRRYGWRPTEWVWSYTESGWRPRREGGSIRTLTDASVQRRAA